MSIVTCHTDGCDNNGIPIEMTLTYEVEDEWGVVTTVVTTNVVCGPCGQPITDIAESG